MITRFTRPFLQFRGGGGELVPTRTKVGVVDY